MRDTQFTKLVNDVDFRRANERETKNDLRRMLAQAVRNTAAMRSDSTNCQRTMQDNCGQQRTPVRAKRTHSRPERSTEVSGPGEAS